MIYRTDYHTHTTFSDGRAAPENYIPIAIDAGLSELGFSDHLTLFNDQQEWNMDPDNVPGYVDYINSLGKKTDTIKIRTGLEVDYFAGKEKETADFLENFDLDYIIGSVHYLGEKSVDEGPDFYQGKNLERLYESYFTQICNAASSGLFDIIAHCDLIRIFGYTPTTDLSHLYKHLAKTLKKNDVVFEINTNGRNRPIADFYPDRKYLHIFEQEKVAVCVNSDAHMPTRIGQYFDEAYELLRFTGFNEMAIFEKRERTMISF